MYNKHKQKTTKRCHYVPQSYLKAFACDEEQEFIWQINKKGKEIPKKIAISDAAVKNYLYIIKNEANEINDDKRELITGQY